MITVQAVKEGRAVQRPPIQEIVAKTRALPSLPVILTKVMQLADSDHSEVGELERLIRTDQALSCRVLAAANSAYCGLSQRVETIGRAVVVLGLKKVKECCLGAGLMGLMGPGSALNPEESRSLWMHSLLTAEAAAAVARRSGQTEPDLAFTAGLLHDLGKVALLAHLTQVHGRSLIRTWSEAETVLGFDHEQLGLGLAEHWRLPPVLAEAMARHHSPDPALTYGQVVATVHIGDSLSGIFDESGPAVPQTQALAMLGLRSQDLDACLTELVKKHQGILELWQSMNTA